MIFNTIAPRTLVCSNIGGEWCLGLYLRNKWLGDGLLCVKGMRVESVFEGNSRRMVRGFNHDFLLRWCLKSDCEEGLLERQYCRDQSSFTKDDYNPLDNISYSLHFTN